MNITIVTKRAPSRDRAAAPARGETARRVARRIDYWVEDHATPLVLGALGLFVASGGVLLAWKTAKVISLAGEFGPVLAVVSVVTGGALGLLRFLRTRRTRRMAAQVAPAPVSAGADSPEPSADRA